MEKTPEEIAIQRLAGTVENLAEMVAHFARMDNEGGGNRAPDDIADLDAMRHECRELVTNLLTK